MRYIVQPGDTLYSIALRFATTYQQIMEANRLTNSTIYPGQELFIPILRQQPVTYTVRPGDTLFLIAQRYNTTVESIIALNNLSGTVLNVGQQLRIPLYTEVVVNVDSANIRSGPGLKSETQDSL